jgi:glycosyltransferase involved in cell wall biosynthesis
MRVSVVIITRNEAPRLRLVLESIAAQKLVGADGRKVDMEVVVVDDASNDDTRRVIAEMQGTLRLQVVHHDSCRGRSPSRNEGVRAASGEIVILFDGDCLAAPDLVTRHAEIHAQQPQVMGRGETFHIRCTRFFLDPEVGTPMPGQEDRVQRMGDDLKNALITRGQIRQDFSAVAARGEPGIYAGAGPRRLYELEMRALDLIPNARILWMTAPGQNFSLRRRDFLAVGGFDPRLSLNEHRELARRLYTRGTRMVPVKGARSYHLLHRTGWRDPLEDGDWERDFSHAHPGLETTLMIAFWLSLARVPAIPAEARIESLEQMESILERGTPFDYEAMLRVHKSVRTTGRQAQTPPGHHRESSMATAACQVNFGERTPL